MDWGLASSDCVLSTTDFDPLSPQFPNCWNQLDFSKSTTGFEEISPNNFVSTSLKDFSSNSPNLKYTKDMSQQVNGSDFRSLDPLEEWFEGLTNCQFLNMDQMDDIFINTFSDEEINTKISPTQTISNPLDETLSFESKFANIPNDPLNNNLLNQNGAGISAGLDANAIPLTSEDLSVNSFLMSQSPMISEVSGMIDNNTWANNDVANQQCSDADILQDLESALMNINGETRICFRDAFYRMANNSKTRNYVNEKRTQNSSVYGSEKGTNVIDRAVATMMYNVPCGANSDMWGPQTPQASTPQYVDYADI